MTGYKTNKWNESQKG